ncbi:DMT family transporter [Lentibacter algarum]|uniref:DMT family transporter n=1 Tax=Lentibacter algarum TaxID=576131 RepID=UPI00339D3379
MSRLPDHLKGLLITLVGVLFVIPDSLFVRLLDAPPIEISFWRSLTCGALLLVYVLPVYGLSGIRKAFSGGWISLVYLVAMGSTGVLFALAVRHTSVANVVIILASMPVFSALISRVFLSEPIRLRMILTMAAVFVGLGIIVYGSGETEGTSLVGDAYALAVSVIFAVALTAARSLRSVSMVPMLPVAYLAAAVVLWPFVTPTVLPSGQINLAVLHGGFIAISSIGLALGPRYISSAEVALLILLESVLAPLLV